MSSKSKLSEKIIKFIRIPLYFLIIWVLLTAICFYFDLRAGICMAIATVCYALITIIFYVKFKPVYTKKLVEFGAEYSQIQKQMLNDLDVPFGLLDETGRILWANDMLKELVQGEDIKNKNVISVFDKFDGSNIQFDENGRNEFMMTYAEREYKVVLKEFSLDPEWSTKKSEDGQAKADMIAFYLFDYSYISQLEKENADEKMIIGHIYLDNYDELMQEVEPARRTLTLALIDRKIAKYFGEYDGIVRKVENDKYFVFFKAKYLNQMQSDKFSILDDVKEISTGDNIDATLSIGLGRGNDKLIDNYELAGSAIDLALGRGGDQAVLKDGNKVYYYGGKSKSVEKNTKVKSRVKATAFRELLIDKEEVYIMGHHLADNDAFGSAIGFYRIAQTLGKDAHIVLGEYTSTVAPLVEDYKEDADYPDNMFMTGSEALDEITKNDVLIIVDCHSSDYAEEPALVNRAQTKVVVDHHRQKEDAIENVQLSYIELSASSSCELVVEIMQYIEEAVRLPVKEANTMYGGIMVDTNNFTRHVGVRTFEAAAYLRKQGAEISTVNKMFRNKLEDYKAKADTISNAEVYKDVYAISVCTAKDVESPTTVGAQAANELLTVKDIKASFVLTPYNDQVYISARAVDKNVQLLMEEFGGGGHMTLAGAQVKGEKVEDVVKKLKKLITSKMKEGEL
ncbi:MAG: DHH family phosphoesterase [Eubacterium sp.]|nr:DHH family phosphoesterase [Eubacterium sp.]